jgi:hypothetical protein
MDHGDSDAAWAAFRNAQEDNPQADELCVLEVELLVGPLRDFLRQHPEAFDSLDILDDLTTAVGRHAQAQSRWVDALMLTPLLTRTAALVGAACQDTAEVVRPWTLEENRPALRGLFRLFQQQLSRHDQAAATATAHELLRLNPADPLGVGSVLENLSHS